MRTILELFWSFCQIGFTSFGGLSMLPLINDEMVTHGWLTAAEVSDIVAIAEMTPGPLGLNCASFAGMRVAGLLGAIAANLGVMMPSLTICAVAAVFFQRFQKSRVLNAMMAGVRPAALGIILSVMVTLSASNYFIDGAVSLRAAAIGVVCFVVLLWRKWSVPLVIILSAVLGLAFL